MNSDKLVAELGRQPFVPWPYFDELMPSHREWHFERSGFRGSPQLLKQLLYCRPPSGVSLEEYIAQIQPT
jgi:dTDP-4-dehydrorhamnose reductase